MLCGAGRIDFAYADNNGPGRPCVRRCGRASARRRCVHAAGHVRASSAPTGEGAQPSSGPAGVVHAHPVSPMTSRACLPAPLAACQLSGFRTLGIWRSSVALDLDAKVDRTERDPSAANANPDVRRNGLTIHKRPVGAQLIAHEQVGALKLQRSMQQRHALIRQLNIASRILPDRDLCSRQDGDDAT